MSGGDFDIGRFARTLTLIVFVTAVFVIIAAIRLDGAVFRIGAVAIGTVGFITAVVGFLISASMFYETTA